MSVGILTSHLDLLATKGSLSPKFQDLLHETPFIVLFQGLLFFPYAGRNQEIRIIKNPTKVEENCQFERQ